VIASALRSSKFVAVCMLGVEGGCENINGCPTLVEWKGVCRFSNPGSLNCDSCALEPGVYGGGGGNDSVLLGILYMGTPIDSVVWVPCGARQEAKFNCIVVPG
jgi:hypothetical protein